IETSSKVQQDKIINTLNYINFIGGRIYAYFKHPVYEEGIIIAARPEPCSGEFMTCRLLEKDSRELKLAHFSFEHLVIIREGSALIVPAQVKELNDDTLTLKLPDYGYAAEHRKITRHECINTRADVIQRGFFASGALVDFSPVSFRIRINPATRLHINWYNSEDHATVNLICGNRILFSGSCRCIRQIYDSCNHEMVLCPTEETINRFRKHSVRNPRHKVEPKATAVFVHPFFQKRITREIGDISNSGFSVFEDLQDSVLAVGMIVPDLEINYAGAFAIQCTAQVIYRQEVEDNAVRCGLAILDMGIRDFSILNQFLNYSHNEGSYVSCTVDMGALWEFFFDTGFIYPQKYQHLASHIQDFKEVYRKLYQNHPEIARHFTYEKNGKIQAHLSMVRAFERTWLMQHHAARHNESKLAGFHVLKQTVLFLTGISRLPSGHMDYVTCFYRPENKFPDRLFGGFARDAENPHISSLDLFAYTSIPEDIEPVDFNEDWTLREISPIEIWELERFYTHRSGGLLLKIIDIGRKNVKGNQPLEEVFKEAGFLRTWKTYSLLYKGYLHAVFIVNQSSFGINLSHLLNSIMIIVMDESVLSGNIVLNAAKMLASTFHLDKMPMLIYPSDYASRQLIDCEKLYYMWILDMKRHAYDFMEHTQKKFRMRY
ncbi:MAG: hypothetical protein M0P57_15140, partial [Syntrophales bacterium]|nr:hypothetical protein [Syntrophales bacterium]